MPDLATMLRDWIHETPLSLCGAGADTCPDWGLAFALAKAVENPDDRQAVDDLMARTRKTMEMKLR